MVLIDYIVVPKLDEPAFKNHSDLHMAQISHHSNTTLIHRIFPAIFTMIIQPEYCSLFS